MTKSFVTSFAINYRSSLLCYLKTVFLPADQDKKSYYANIINYIINHILTQYLSANKMILNIELTTFSLRKCSKTSRRMVMIRKGIISKVRSFSPMKSSALVMIKYTVLWRKRNTLALKREVLIRV